MATAVVIGGVPERQSLRPLRALGAGSTVIAADSGWDLAIALGLHVDLLIGDMDSISDGGLLDAERSRARVERRPIDKDATDLELALVAASQLDDRHVVVIGGEGGRLDHLLGNVTVLASPRFAELVIEGWTGRAYVAVVRHRWRRAMQGGALVTILPWGADATVSARGVRWPLDHEDLPIGTSRGVSNEALGGEVDVEVHQGVAVVVVPESDQFTGAQFT